MSKKTAARVIRLRGVRHNNLKNFDLDLPLNQLIVITGLSGSGKSSLAFDTLFAEGQRRYIETFSPYARQFFDRMDKPQVDSIEGIPPAIAIEQRNSVRSTRSTVGTMTEICDYLKVLWPQVSQLHCRKCGRLVRKDSPQQIWETLNQAGATAPGEILITFELPVSEKLSLKESLELIAKQGYQRLLIGGEIVRLEDVEGKFEKAKPAALTIAQDRLKPVAENRARFVEAAEQAYHFGKGRLALHSPDEVTPRAAFHRTHLFSNRLHCAECDLAYREPSPALFSFNHPVGACPACKGFGRIISIDYNLALPEKWKTIAGGVVKPWQTGQSAECQEDLMKFARLRKAPVDVPFQDLPQKWQDWVINGDPHYGQDKHHEWPKAWYGVKGYFRWLESKSYKMHVRVLLSRYRSYTKCPECHGQRFQPESLLYQVGYSNGTKAELLTLSDFYCLPIRDSLAFVENLAGRYSLKPSDPLGLALNEVRSRLRYLDEVGLGYITLDRPTRSLSGGETERVNLTTCLGSRLVNTLFVLDEPSVGLHARDTGRLVGILESLRTAGNTVVVVEHEAAMMRAADTILDIGPGHGATGGEIVFQGSYADILKSSHSLTGQYLSGRKQIPVPKRRPVNFHKRGEDRTVQWLKLEQATLHNLNHVSVEIPLGRLVCLTGVSGSGKSTLARDILLPQLNFKLNYRPAKPGDADAEDSSENDDAELRGDSALSAEGAPRLFNWESLGRVVFVDQSSIAKTPRSNPAVYVGAFDDLRELFAQSDLAKQRGLDASAFSFNSAKGQCERCRGAGFEKIEMQFLSDVFIRCPECNGRRYRPHILEIKIADGAREWSIADLLEATVDETVEFLARLGESRSAQRAAASIKLLQEVGLGYLHLGQPINTLSGGESQRLKLVSHLAEFSRAETASAKPTLFLFDEPTTGLHFHDVGVLLEVFQRLVNAGHSVLIIEHNLDVIKSADWVIDLGPDAGDQGGRVVAQGTPEQIAKFAESHTGKALKDVAGVGRPPQFSNGE